MNLVLTLRGQDVGWPSGANIVLLPVAKPPPEKLKGSSQAWRGL